MVIVVFGNKIEMIHQAHRCLQPRVKHCASEPIRVEIVGALHQFLSGPSEIGENLIQGTLIVLGVMGLLISEIRNREFNATGREIVHSRRP